MVFQQLPDLLPLAHQQLHPGGRNIHHHVITMNKKIPKPRKMDENDKKKLAYHKYYFDPRYTPHSHMEFGTLLCWGTNLVDDIFSNASTS